MYCMYEPHLLTGKLGKECTLKALVYWYLSGCWRLVCHPVTPSSPLTLSLCRLMFMPCYVTLIFNLCKSLKSTLTAKIKRALMDAIMSWHNVVVLCCPVAAVLWKSQGDVWWKWYQWSAEILRRDGAICKDSRSWLQTCCFAGCSIHHAPL